MGKVYTSGPVWKRPDSAVSRAAVTLLHAWSKLLDGQGVYNAERWKSRASLARLPKREDPQRQSFTLPQSTGYVAAPLIGALVVSPCRRRLLRAR